MPFLRVACFEEHLEAPLAVQWESVRHRVKLRTVNLASKAFEKSASEKGHLRLRSERAALKLALATMLRASIAGTGYQ